MRTTLKSIHTAALRGMALLAVTLLPMSHASDIEAIPFAKRSGSGERMVFTKIDPSESRLIVQNNYDDPAMWGEHYSEFQGGAVGVGIAAADVDADGLVDLYVVNKTGPNKLFRQVAPFRFQDVTETAGVPGGKTWGTGASFADVDNDGDVDLYVCQFNGPNLLYLNNGSGVFSDGGQAAGVDLVSGSVVGAFEDYDRDGDIDLFVVTNLLNANRSSEGEPDRLFRNRGDGTFEEITEAAGIALDRGRGHSATWWDFNADGWPDLYVANDFSAPDHLYRNNGDGTFTDQVETSLSRMPWFAMGSDFADVNNDGLFDLLVADMAGTTHFKSKVTMGDMGGLVNHMDTLVTPQYMNNAMFLNTGTDRFMEVARLAGLASTDWSWSARFEDLDNDGWVDLHVTNGMVRSFTDSDLINQSKKIQSRNQVVALMKNSPPLRERNLAFHNDGNLHFTKVQSDWGLEHEGVSFGSVFADFDNDGDLDLAYANFEDTVSLYRNDCPAGNSLIIQLRGSASNTLGIGAQAVVETSSGTQIRKLTVARGALSSSEPIMHFGLGGISEVTCLEIRWPSGHVQQFKNLTANTRYVVTEPVGTATLPLAVTHRTADEGLFTDQAKELGIDFANEERVFDDMKRQSLLPNRMNTLGGGVALGDANGDGRADIYFAGSAGQAGALYLATNSGVYERSQKRQPWDANAEVEEMSPLWVDVDSDGDLDLFVSSGSSEPDEGSENLLDHLYLNNGQASFSEADPSRFENAPRSSSVVASADFDHDGDLDLFVGGRLVVGDYPRAPESVLLENRDGHLVNVTQDVCPAVGKVGMVTSALWTDANGDGLVDLLVAGEWMAPRLFMNRDGKLVDRSEAAGLADHPGWWNSLTGADLDRDGDIDFVALNVGLNTKYHASPDHPVQIFYGDFEDSGTCQIVEGEYEGDSLFPVRGRSCSSRAMPSIAEKFPTFRDFGSALLADIYTEEKLNESLKVYATELAHGVFLNNGEGRFSFRPLPRIAQVSPGFGCAAEDFNGDGNIDILIAQNFRGPQVETGRFDGGIGILLSGDGEGGFTPVTAKESGISIESEGRGLAVADLNGDGWPDVILTRINRNAMALINHGSTENQSFSIRLRGRNDNPNAVGAKMEVRYTDGSTRGAEVYAGSSYLSQSDARAFFSYSNHNPPKSIHVRWPDGRSSVYAFNSEAVELLLREDS